MLAFMCKSQNSCVEFCCCDHFGFFWCRLSVSSSDKRTMNWERKWKKIIISGIETWNSWGYFSFFSFSVTLVLYCLKRKYSKIQILQCPPPPPDKKAVKSVLHYLLTVSNASFSSTGLFLAMTVWECYLKKCPTMGILSFAIMKAGLIFTFNGGLFQRFLSLHAPWVL